MNTFYLKITACDRVFFEGECVYLSFPGVDGSLGVMAHHQPMATVVENGLVRFRLPDGSEQEVIVSDGMMNVDNNRVDILAFSAERPDEIDIRAAERELEIAREQLQQKQSLIEYNLSSASMARAMARLSGARRRKSDEPL